MLLAVLVACSDNPPEFVPLVDTPEKGSDAYPYDAIENLTLSIARSGATASIALETGTVGSEVTLSSVPFGEDLVVHLSGTLGNEELAYGRTCAVDILEDSGERLTPHLYFSRLVRWGVGPRLESERNAALLGVSLESQGLVLFLEPDSVNIDLVDPTSARGEPMTRLLGAQGLARNAATLSPLGDGAIVVGGVDVSGNATATIEFIQPTEIALDAQLRTTPGPALKDHGSVVLQDGRVLVAGGLLQNDSSKLFEHSNKAWVFSLLDGELRQREIAPGLSISRTGHTMTRLGNEAGADVLIIGGIDNVGNAIAQSELYRPLRSAFENSINGQLLHPRFGHRSVRLPGGFVLVVGGDSIAVDGERIPVSELELYDPVTGMFSEAGMLPDSAGLVGMSVTELPDGRFLLSGGTDRMGAEVATVLIARFDPIDGVIDLSPTASLSVPRSFHAAVRMCDGTILVAGGSTVSAETERYSPPSARRR